MTEKIKRRFKFPTRYDKAPYNNLYLVEDDDTSQFPDYKSDPFPKMYVQVSENEDFPWWVAMGDLLVGAHLLNVEQDNLRHNWIHSYKENYPKQSTD